MHPRLVELTAYLDLQRTVLAAAVESVPAAQRATRPPSGGWSVAEVLEHLVLVERRIAGLSKTWLEEARASGLASEEDDSPVLPTINTAAVMDRSRRVDVSPAGTPTGALSADVAIREIDAIRAELVGTLLCADGLALSQIVKPHPVLGPSNLYQWIIFTAAHMGRHAAQIREVGLAIRVGQGV